MFLDHEAGPIQLEEAPIFLTSLSFNIKLMFLDHETAPIQLEEAPICFKVAEL